MNSNQYRVGLLSSILLLMSGCFMSLGAAENSIQFTDKGMTATLKQSALQDVFENISGQREIWFRGQKSVMDRQVTVRFVDLTFDEGLKRILRGINYMIVAAENNEVEGVILQESGTGGTLTILAAKNGSDEERMAAIERRILEKEAEWKKGLRKRKGTQFPPYDPANDPVSVLQKDLPPLEETELQPGDPDAVLPGGNVIDLQAEIDLEKAGMVVERNVAPPVAEDESSESLAAPDPDTPFTNFGEVNDLEAILDNDNPGKGVE